jgi:hypothetical protein
MIYTAWGTDGRPSTLVPGEGPPRFANGEPMDEAAAMIWRIEADSWEEAMQRFYDLQGWGTYKPMADDPPNGR